MFRIEKKIDSGGWLYKENLSLDGSVEDIFLDMTRSSLKIIDCFINDYPDLRFKDQNGHGKSCRRISPGQSRIKKSQIKNMSTEELYNFIRCRQDPYPNVYLEDEFGKLIFKNVEYEWKKK